MKIVHCLHDVETNEYGIETAVSPELICRATPTVLKDDSMVWGSKAEAKRMEQTLIDAYNNDEIMDVDEIITVVSEEGYQEVSTIYSSPDEGIIEHHILCRNQSAEGLNIVAELSETGDGEYYVSNVRVQNYDMEHDDLIIRLRDESDIDLAHNHGLLCLDDDGYHIQVRTFASVMWQCLVEDEVDQDRIRKFWSHTVRNQS